MRCLPCRRSPHCLSQAAWLAVQEAAKQCVAARLRTPLGGPAQLLSALEGALHAEAGRQAGADRGQNEAAVLLLLFLFALEQGIGAAAAGSGSRAAAPPEAAAFFAANEKVGPGAARMPRCASSLDVQPKQSNLKLMAQ